MSNERHEIGKLHEKKRELPPSSPLTIKDEFSNEIYDEIEIEETEEEAQEVKKYKFRALVKGRRSRDLEKEVTKYITIRSNYLPEAGQYAKFMKDVVQKAKKVFSRFIIVGTERIK